MNIFVVFIVASAASVVEGVVIGISRIFRRTIINIDLCHGVPGGYLLTLRNGLLIDYIIFICRSVIRHKLIDYSKPIKKFLRSIKGKTDALRHGNLFRSLA